MSVVKPLLTFDVPKSSTQYHLPGKALLKARPYIKTSSTVQSDFKTLAAHHGGVDRPMVDNNQACKTTFFIARKTACARGMKGWV
jgi:hypothetical protein